MMGKNNYKYVYCEITIKYKKMEIYTKVLTPQVINLVKR